MQVFKTYFKLLKSYKGTLLIYFAVFLGVSIVLVKNLTNSAAEQVFTSDQLDLALIDRDCQTLGPAIKKYFEGEHQFLDVADDEEAILNELYWRQADYVLVLPAGYEESIQDEKIPDLELQCMKIPGIMKAVILRQKFFSIRKDCRDCLHADIPWKRQKRSF